MEYRVDFSSPIIFLDGNEFGHVGENNRAILVVTPTTEMMECADIRYICLVCEVGREFVKTVVKSELYDKEAEIRIPLWEDATVSETGKLQIEGSDDEGNILYKSDLVEFSLKQSASGVSQRPFEPSKPSNPADGEMVKQNLQIAEYRLDDIEAAVRVYTNNVMTIEADLPENARVKRIELLDVDNGIDEYMSLEDMTNFDPIGNEVPYSFIFPKNKFGTMLPVAAHIYFPISTNDFYDRAQSYTFTGKFKIYYEIEE